MRPPASPARCIGVLVLAFALLAAPLARADAPPAAATPTAPAKTENQGADLNFNLFGEQAPHKTPAEALADARRQAAFSRKVRLRRRLLLAHQAFGFITLGLLAATLVLGTLNYVDKFGGGDDNGRYYNLHLGFASAASATFATTGVLALAAPNPYPKPIRLDPALLHKVSMALAAACMAAELVLGPLSASRDGSLDQRSIALAHLTIGFASFGFMAAGTLAWVFK